MEVFMFALQLIVIGLMVIGTPPLSAESPAMEILKSASHIMVQEFKAACESNITVIRSIKPAPEKPEGYGNKIPYSTNKDKIGILNDLAKLLIDAPAKVQKIINDTPDSNEGILKNFREIYGILNEGRKNCLLSLSQIEKQDLKTQTLKESQSDPKKNQEALKACQAALDRKKPSTLSQAKNLLRLGKKKAEDTSSAPPAQEKKIGPDEKSRILIESLQKNGLM
jgi:hypothetical protein